MKFDVTILGSSGAIPAHNRHPTAQIINYNSQHFLIDCGEGTQMRMSELGIKRGRLDYIFISHLHGDHFFGLMGLLTSFHLNKREHPLHLFGPEGLGEIISTHFKYSQTQLRFELLIHPVEATQPSIIFEDHNLTVQTIILKHRIPTTGFLFREKINQRKIRAEKLEEYQIPTSLILDLKKGADFTTSSGVLIPNAELTFEPKESRAYAYCSDTMYDVSFVEQIRNVNLLYHEATFIEVHRERAIETMHSTAKEAAEIAKLANVGKLLVGHFSARYESLELLLEEGREVFPNTFLATEGEVFEVL